MPVDDVDLAGVAHEQFAFGPFGHGRQGGEGGLAHAEPGVGRRQRAPCRVRSGRHGGRPSGWPGRQSGQAVSLISAARVRVRLAQQRLQGYLHEGGIAVPGGAVGEGELGGFGDAMHELR